MKKLIFILFALPVVVVVLLLLTKMRWKFSKPPKPTVGIQQTVATNVAVTAVSAPVSLPSGRFAPLHGETIRRD